MTTVAMVFGMLPIALSVQAGAEWKSGLAWVLVGGLRSSLLLTLVLVPVVYFKVDEWKERIPAFFARLMGRLRSRKLSLGKRAPELAPENSVELMPASAHVPGNGSLQADPLLSSEKS